MFVSTEYTNNNKSRPYVDDRETSLHLSKVIINLQNDLEKVVRSVNAIEQRIGQAQKKVINVYLNTVYSSVFLLQSNPREW